MMAAQAFFNHASIPAASAEEAYDLIVDMIRSLSTLVKHELCANGLMSSTNMYTYELAPGYTLGDFETEALVNSTGRDLAVFLGRMAFWHSSLTRMPEATQSYLELCEVTLPDAPHFQEPDILAAAYLEDGFTTSLGTTPVWGANEIRLGIQECDSDLKPKGPVKKVTTPNLSGRGNIGYVNKRLTDLATRLVPENWEAALPCIDRHEKFTEWFLECDAVCKKKIMDKSHFIQNLGFQCGEPHVKSLNNFDFNAKEVRIAVHGNLELRIIFTHLGDGEIIYILGGIKDGDDWYNRIRHSANQRYLSINT